LSAISKATRGKRMDETVIIYGNPNHSGYATFLYTSSRYLNRGNKTANIIYNI